MGLFRVNKRPTGKLYRKLRLTKWMNKTNSRILSKTKETI